MISSEIHSDAKMLRLSERAGGVFIRLITLTDQEGIVDCDPIVVRARLSLRRSVGSVAADLDAIAAEGLMVRYGEGGTLAFLPGFFISQTLASPTATTQVRPPKALVASYPRYLEGRAKAFGSKKATGRRASPFGADGHVAGNGAGHVPGMPGACTPEVNRKEGKGREEKGREGVGG